MTWLLVMVGICANAAASALVKTTAPATNLFGSIAGMLVNGRLVAAIACYGLAFVAYSAAVQRLPLNIAHPVSTAGAIVLVGLISAIGFQESFSGTRIAGYALLLAGIVVLLVAGLQESA